jgi:hypothetical protein
MDFLFVGRVVTRLSRRGRRVLRSGWGSFLGRRAAVPGSGRGGQGADRVPDVDQVSGAGPVRAQVQPAFSLASGQAARYVQLPTISTRARSARSWPRSYSGLEPRRRIAAESPARSPVPSASSRNGSSPAWASSRSSSPTSSRPAAHEVPCTEEVHPPQPDRDPRQIAFLLVRCTSPLFRAFHARRVANPGERRRPRPGLPPLGQKPAEPAVQHTQLRLLRRRPAG